MPEKKEERKEEVVGEPTVSGFRVKARRTSDKGSILNALSAVSFLEIAEEKDELAAINVESRDIQKNPYAFSITYFRGNTIEMLYTCVPGMSPRMRRLMALKYFLNMLTVVGRCYEMDTREIVQLFEASLSEMEEFVTIKYGELFSKYDELKSEVDSLQKKAKALTEANDSLSRENHWMKEQNDKLVLRVRSLETHSDSVLMSKVQEWISDHGGEINVSDFSKVHEVPETRVEEILNELIRLGYIEAKV